MRLSWAARGTRRAWWRLPLLLALGVWLCTVPLVGAAVALGLPWEAAWPTLGVLLAVALLACFVLCRTALRPWRQDQDAWDALHARPEQNGRPCGRHGNER